MINVEQETLILIINLKHQSTMNNQFLMYATIMALAVVAGCLPIYFVMIHEQKPKQEGSWPWYLVGALTFLVLIAAVVGNFPEQCDYPPEGWDVIQRICCIVMASGIALLFVIGFIISVYRSKHRDQKSHGGPLVVHVVKVHDDSDDEPDLVAKNGSSVNEPAPESAPGVEDEPKVQNP